MSDFRCIARLKRRIAANYLIHHLRRAVAVHIVAFFLVAACLMTGGFLFFWRIFDYLMDLDVIGPPLMDKVAGMVLMAFFSMLIFSNLIVTLSTAYISREVDFYVSLPVRLPTVFFVRFWESVAYSSWAFVILALPLFVAYGVARGADAPYYLAVVLLTAPFLLIPAALGAMVTMTVSALFPARRTFRMAILLGALGVAATVAMVRLMGLRTAMTAGQLDTFRDIMSFLNVGSAPVLPSAWLNLGLNSAVEDHWKDCLYWMAALWATGLFLMQVLAWMAPRLYYRGWRLAGESSSVNRNNGASRWAAAVDRSLRFLGPQTRAMVSKDIKTFWRDPAQWSQLMILFGLLFIYVANLRSAAQYNRQIVLNNAFWQTLISFFNLGAACFVLSILTTRFVYPMLSLEGKQFWTLGLAPLKREGLVWEKYWLCWAGSFFLTFSLTLFSNFVLGVEPAMAWMSMGTVLLMSFALTSISIGLGALTPNFKEDNPARIANGMGGTMNIFISLAYVGLVIALELWPAFLVSTDRIADFRSPGLIFVFCGAALLAVNAAAIIVPMRLGLRRWREFEF